MAGGVCVLTPAHWQAAVATAIAVLMCVLLHYETLNLLDLAMQRFRSHWRRPRILVLMFSLILLHIVEIWVFGMGYWWLAQDAARGSLQAANATTIAGLLDYVYFSAVVYTTLGLGDLVPHGALRFMVGTQALVGFLLVTWSASFTFVEMSRWWRRRP